MIYIWYHGIILNYFYKQKKTCIKKHQKDLLLLLCMRGCGSHCNCMECKAVQDKEIHLAYTAVEEDRPNTGRQCPWCRNWEIMKTLTSRTILYPNLLRMSIQHLKRLHPEWCPSAHRSTQVPRQWLMMGQNTKTSLAHSHIPVTYMWSQLAKWIWKCITHYKWSCKEEIKMNSSTQNG